jgi:hypothetical protein
MQSGVLPWSMAKQGKEGGSWAKHNLLIALGTNPFETQQ